MALISCPECRYNISSEALTCPHCGVHLNQAAPPPPRKQIVLSVFVVIVSVAALIISIVSLIPDNSDAAMPEELNVPMVSFPENNRIEKNDMIPEDVYFVQDFWDQLEQQENSTIEGYKYLSQATANVLDVSADYFNFDDGWMMCELNGFADVKYSRYIELFKNTWELTIMVSNNKVRLISFGSTEQPIEDLWKIISICDDIYEEPYELSAYCWLTTSDNFEFIIVDVSNKYKASGSTNLNGNYNNLLLTFQCSYV